TLRPLDAFERLCGSSAESVSGAEQGVRISKIGTCIHGIGERRDGRLSVAFPEADKGVCYEGPGFVGIAGEGTADALGGRRESAVRVLPSLEDPPSEAHRPEAMRLGVAWIQFDGAIQHADRLPGRAVGMLAEEEHAADE